MTGFVPLTAFEHEAQAVIAVDRNACVSLCNCAARRLLGLPNDRAISSRCWDLCNFRTLGGGAFCRPRCPVREAAQEGRAGAQHWIVPTSGPRSGQPIELVSFFVPSTGADRCGVLHFLRPASLATASDRTGSPTTLEAVHAMSHREIEVIGLLAEGHTTGRIAAELGISANTVRNHVQSIFRKLGVHRRVEALLAFRRVVADVSDTEPI